MKDNSSPFAEARVIIRRGNVVIPLTEWLKPDDFVEAGTKFKALHDTLPKSVVMSAETRTHMFEGDDAS